MAPAEAGARPLWLLILQPLALVCRGIELLQDEAYLVGLKWIQFRVVCLPVKPEHFDVLLQALIVQH
jgi:hypothetical protein